MSLRSKLIVAFLLVGIVPFAIVAVISLNKTIGALEAAAFNQLESLRAVKKSQIEDFFQQRKGDTQVLVETATAMMEESFRKLEAIRTIKQNQIQSYFDDRLAGATHALKDTPLTATAVQEFARAYKAGGNNVRSAQWTAVRDKYHDWLEENLDENGYIDIFLVTMSGDVVYTVTQQEGGLGDNLESGFLKDSGLAEAFRKTRDMEDAEDLGFSDFRPYGPSDDMPAAFLGGQIEGDDGKPVGILVLQVPLDPINVIMQERTGMGDSGETYLVGPDHLMRSNSFQDQENRSVEASFANPSAGSVETEAVQKAFAGEVGVDIIQDYYDNPVLSAFSTIDVYGVEWVILAEMSVDEAFVPRDATGKDFYKKYVEAYGYYDLFLIMPDGYIFYTAFKEPDYQTNILSGEYSSSSLGSLVKRVLETGKYAIEDFAPYEPSNNAPAAFVAQPVIHPEDQETEMVVALQLSLATINGVMQQREGLGETGQTYLVGNDKLMRSDSIIDPDSHSVEASFADPTKGSVNTVASNNALVGEVGSGIEENYLFKNVLTAYTPVSIGDMTWALIAEVDESEAMAAVTEMEVLMLMVAAVGVLAIAVAGFLAGQSMAKPIIGMTTSMGVLADGNLEAEIPSQDRVDEIGKMAAAVQVFKENAIEVKRLEAEQKESEKRAEQEKREMMMHMADDFEASVGGVVNSVSSASTEMQSSAEAMTATADQTSNQSTAASAAAEEASSNVQTVASAAEELSSSISEISRQVAQSTQISASAVSEVDGANEKVQGLAEAAQKIGEVVALITDIADQTNLLALNATIEAARAGEAGKGFAVVASEVKNLANATAKATEEISTQIGGIQDATQDAVSAIGSIGGIINQMNEIASTIAAAVEEQGAATQEIARNVEQASSGTTEVSSNITQVNQGAAETGQSAQQMLAAAGELSQQSETLRKEVDQFLAQIRSG